MKICSFIPFILALVISSHAFAQDAAPTKRRSRISYGVSTMVWQEDIDAKLSGAAVKGRGQALSLGVEAGYERFIGHRAQYFWAAKAGFMTGSMYATAGGQPFKTSSFIGGYIEPGVFRRQTAKTEFGIVFPLTYRIVNWESLNSNLVENDSNQMAYGVGARANFVFNNNNYLSTGLIYRFSQPSALWVISYDFR